MSAIATAIVGTALVGAVVSTNSAKKSAGAQRDATNASIAEQQRAEGVASEKLEPYSAVVEMGLMPLVDCNPTHKQEQTHLVSNKQPWECKVQKPNKLTWTN